MLHKAIEASLVLSLATVVTLLVLAMILPSHPRFAPGYTIDSSAYEPAVFVDGIHSRPGAVDTSRLCPYLARLQATSRCPVLSGRVTVSRCPHLSQPDHQPPAPADVGFPKLARVDGLPFSDSDPS